jgi:hypothetical protein
MCSPAAPPSHRRPSSTPVVTCLSQAIDTIRESAIQATFIRQGVGGGWRADSGAPAINSASALADNTRCD